MSAMPQLTRDIGTAERNLRALLEQELEPAGLSFPEWTVLTVLDSSGPLTTRQLVETQLHGRAVPDASAADATVEHLVSSGLVAPAAPPDHPPDTVGAAGPRLAPTTAGETVYRPVRVAVDRLTDELFRDLPPTDVEATHRTLTEIARRAEARLAGAAAGGKARLVSSGSEPSAGRRSS